MRKQRIMAQLSWGNKPSFIFQQLNMLSKPRHQTSKQKAKRLQSVVSEQQIFLMMRKVTQKNSTSKSTFYNITVKQPTQSFSTC